MGVSTLDGTIEEAVLKRSIRNLRIFHHVRFRLRDGTTKSVAKPIVDARVAHRLQPGVSGRFYLYTTIEQRGIHGIRDDEGQAQFGFPRNNEIAILVITLFNLAWVSLSFYMVGDAPLLPTILLVLGAPYYFYLLKVRGEARRQFEADSQYRAPEPPTLAAEPAVGAG